MADLVGVEGPAKGADRGVAHRYARIITKIVDCQSFKRDANHSTFALRYLAQLLNRILRPRPRPLPVVPAAVVVAAVVEPRLGEVSQNDSANGERSTNDLRLTIDD